MNINIPVMETERLILRGYEPSDFAAYAQMWGDPEVTRFIGGKPFSEEESWAKFHRMFGMWAVVKFGLWAIVEKSSGLYVGEVGFFDAKRDIIPSMAGIPEIGWTLVTAAHGKGYATEAARSALSWGDDHFSKIRTACIISPENTASLRLAQKIGFREAHRTTYKGDPTIMHFRNP